MGEICGEKGYVLDTNELKEWTRILEEPVVHFGAVHSLNISDHSRVTKGLARPDFSSKVVSKATPPIGTDPSLGVREAAEVLGCAPKAVHRLCKEERLSFHWVGNRRKFRVADLEEFREGQRQRAMYQEKMLKKLAAARLPQSERSGLKNKRPVKKFVVSGESKELTVEEIRALCRR